MRHLIERLLSFLFPVRPYRIKTGEEAKIWLQYEVSNHPEIDPFRPLGSRDSWAGHKKEHEAKHETPKQRRISYRDFVEHVRSKSIAAGPATATRNPNGPGRTWVRSGEELDRDQKYLERYSTRTSLAD